MCMTLKLLYLTYMQGELEKLNQLMDIGKRITDQQEVEIRVI